MRPLHQHGPQITVSFFTVHLRLNAAVTGKGAAITESSGLQTNLLLGTTQSVWKMGCITFPRSVRIPPFSLTPFR